MMLGTPAVPADLDAGLLPVVNGFQTPVTWLPAAQASVSLSPEASLTGCSLASPWGASASLTKSGLLPVLETPEKPHRLP